MNQDYLQNWSAMAREMQKPFHAILGLNLKTLQNFKYMKSADFNDIQQPTQLIGKQISLTLENGHRVLDYVQQSFYILERAFWSFSNEFEKMNQQEKSPRDKAEAHNDRNTETTRKAFTNKSRSSKSSQQIKQKMSQTKVKDTTKNSVRS